MYSVLIQQIFVDFLPEIDLHPEKWRSVMNMLVTVSGVVGMLWKKRVSNTFWNVVSMYYWEVFPTEYCFSYPHSNHLMYHKNTSLRYKAWDIFKHKVLTLSFDRNKILISMKSVYQTFPLWLVNTIGFEV